MIYIETDCKLKRLFYKDMDNNSHKKIVKIIMQ